MKRRYALLERNKEKLKDRIFELEKYTTLQKQMKADIVEKNQEIYNLKSLNTTSIEKISSLEQSQSETEEDIKERKIEI